ncbi:MAG: hypothetical protein IPM39_20465 [Chloroflexi bacterium]|nr:hypothetical protein [Chloroflexota bacterium]
MQPGDATICRRLRIAADRLNTVKKVRPLPRERLEHLIAATSPDVSTQFQFQGRTIQVQGWQELVRADQKVADATQTFTIWTFSDPLYKKPMVLGTNLAASAETVFLLYLDRWPVEQPPLVAKQMLGLHRQSVFAPRLSSPAARVGVVGG